FGAGGSAKSESGQVLMSTENIAPAVSRDASVTPPTPPVRPLVTAKDLYEVPRLAGQGVLAWTLPESAWWRLSRFFGRINAATHPQRNRNETADIRSVLPDAPYASRLAAENWANRYEERFQYLRAWRPDGWTPEIDILGTEQVRKALGN